MRGWSATNYSSIPDINLLDGQASAVLQLVGLLPANTSVLLWLNTVRQAEFARRHQTMHTVARYLEFLALPGVPMADKAKTLKEWGVPQECVRDFLNGRLV